MRELRLIVAFSVLSVTICRGQTGRLDEVQAHDAVKRFLQGIKLAALPEGKQMLVDTQWILGAADYGQNFYSRPDYTEVNSLYAGLFDTDVPGIKGYKELFDMKAVNKAGTTKNLKFLVIAFKDVDSEKWKVLTALDNDGDESALDLERNAAYFKNRLADTENTSAMENYQTYGQWLLVAGRINEAKTTLAFAKTASPVSSLSQSLSQSLGSEYVLEEKIQLERESLQLDALLDVIEKVTVHARSK